MDESGGKGEFVMRNHATSVQWLILRNGGIDFLHSRFIDFILYKCFGSVMSMW